LDKDFHNRIRKNESWYGFNFNNAHKKDGKVDWKTEIKRLQRKYDQPIKKETPRVAKKLWRLKEKIHLEIEQFYNTSQKQLDRFKRALDVKGVIYAIFSIRSKKIYIGQTKGSCFHRFQQHCWSSWSNQDNDPLHKAIRDLGWRTFFVFPLQVF
jgi:hypothetical protein